MADKALLTGINNYANVSDLRGCLNDVRNIKKLLIDVFRFSESNIRTLQDDEVRKERLEKEWKWLVKDAKAGDRLLFHFSGHGSQIADENGDEDDGVDELLCLHDMDFADPDTYLLDDDLRELTEKVPEDVHLTVILDNCHSGTATRLLVASKESARGLAPSPEKAPLVDMDATLSRMKPEEVRALGASPASSRAVSQKLSALSRDTVLVRYIPPPPEVQEKLYRNGVRKSFGRDVATMEMNHVLLAGSKSEQTSADAYIDNDFNGAFTFHMCKTIREHGDSIDHQDLITEVRKAILSGGFSQVPQLEPEGTRGPFLQSTKRGRKPPQSGGGSPVGNEATREILGIVREIRDEVRELRRERQSDRGSSLRGSSGRRALVYVHGICFHKPGYSDAWWESLKPHLPSDLAGQLQSNRHEVLWSDLVSRQRALAADVPDPQEARALEQELEDVLKDRAEQEAARDATPAQRGTDPNPTELTQERALFGIPGLDCIDDFLKYLLSGRTRRAVQERFTSIVAPLLSAGVDVDVISHSWGTVVAYEALRTMDGRNFTGKVRNFFTVGSALSLPPVRRRVEPEDGQRPEHALKWINLDAQKDFVGGHLAGFSVNKEYLELQPTGCDRVTAACAHSSYFHPRNDAVNRGIFALHMTE